VEVRERGQVTAAETSWALREVTRLSAEVDVQLAHRLSLRPLDHAALGHVMSAPAPLGPAELSARLGISTGSGTELVDRLERAGHLERRRDPTDRRRVALHASPSAVASVLQELAPLFASLDALEDELTAQEQAVVVRYLRASADRLRAFLAAPPGP
jgi:DNA-binding MarR family transcriptional regulator